MNPDNHDPEIVYQMFKVAILTGVDQAKLKKMTHAMADALEPLDPPRGVVLVHLCLLAQSLIEDFAAGDAGFTVLDYKVAIPRFIKDFIDGVYSLPCPPPTED